jgi:large subunit ribosomal protein L35
MPKMKSSRGAAKRFKLTGGGRIRRPSGGGQHGMIGKSRRRRRRLRDNTLASPGFEKRIKFLLPYL